MNAWVLILYIHASGIELNVADFGKDKPSCDAAAVSWNKDHDTGVQTFVCVTKYVQAAGTSPAAPVGSASSQAAVAAAEAARKAEHLKRVPVLSDDFLLGVGVGMMLPRLPTQE